jgi:hypothetical protein
VIRVGRNSFTSLTDMASYVAVVLTGEGHEDRAFEISVNTGYLITEQSPYYQKKCLTLIQYLIEISLAGLI